MYTSLTVSAAHMKFSLQSLIPFLSSLLNLLRLPSPELDQILDNSLKRHYFSLYNTSARPTQKTRTLYCWEDLLTDPLLSNGRSTIARVGFRGNMFTKSLPSNGSVVFIVNFSHHICKPKRFCPYLFSYLRNACCMNEALSVMPL
jgi:hypothetical protein